MMGTNIFLLTPGHGKKSILDNAYNQHLNNVLKTINEEEETKWETYSFIIELLISQGKKTYLQEIKYRLSDGENPNAVILDIIDRESDNIDSLTWFFKRRIEEYLEEDFFRRFYE
jgi:hypothetical protein